MLRIEFHSIAPGRCVWCGREKDEVITLSFADQSFAGAMCFADFRKALRMKLLAGGTQPVAKPALVVPPAAPAERSKP